MKRIILLLLALFSFCFFVAGQSFKSSEQGKSANCECIDSLFQIAKTHQFAGNNEDAVRFYTMVIDGCGFVDSCNIKYLSEAFVLLEGWCLISKQYNYAVTIAKKYLNKLGQEDGRYLNERINALYYISLFDRQNMDEAFAYGKRAEQLILDSGDVDSFRDSLYFEVIYNLAWNRYEVEDYVQAKTYYQLGRDYLIKKRLNNTEDYYEELKGLFTCAYKTGEYRLVLSLAPELEPMIFKYSNNPLEAACGYAIYMYRACGNLGKSKETLLYLDELNNLMEQLEDGLSPLRKARYFSEKASVFSEMGKKEEALLFIQKARTELSKTDGNTVSYYAIKAELLKDESNVTAEYDKALMQNDSALMITDFLIKAAMGQSHFSCKASSMSFVLDSAEYDNAKTEIIEFEDLYASILLSRGQICSNHGAISEAYTAFVECAKLFDESRANDKYLYFACQNNLAVCQIDLGNFSDAINILTRIKNSIEDSFGTHSVLYATVLLNHSNYYRAIKDYDKIIDFCQQAVLISSEIGDEKIYALATFNIGMGLYMKGDPADALHYLEEALVYMESDVFVYNLRRLYQALFSVSYELGNIEEAFQYYEKAARLVESVYGIHSLEYAELLGAKGLALLKKDKEDAFVLLEDAVETTLSIGGTDKYSYCVTLGWYGYSGLVFNKIIDNYSQLVLNALKNYYESNVAYYSAIDRNSFMSDLSAYNSVVYGNRNDIKNDACLYNLALFSKALMLSTSDYFKKCVYHSGDETLVAQYDRIVTLQKAIDNQSFINMQGGVSVEEMRGNLVTMERDLIAKMKESGAYTTERDIFYEDVAKVLKPNEIAVEFVDYYHINDKKTYYVALLAKSSWENPVYVQLCTEEGLKSCLGNPNVTYSTDDLYRLLWQPLAEYINEGDKVYFSPSGMLHTIALESLHTPDGSCLSDKYNLVRLTSTRELCKERQPKNHETGAVYGGLQYDVDQQRMTEVATMNKTVSEESPVFALRGEDRGNWNYLQGTKDEAEHIAGIMRQANIGCELFEGDLGNEESFKALSGQNIDIIHLATHGYFLEGEKADMNDFMQSLSPLARQKTDSVIDPLLRSGLILSGGNRAWSGQEVPEGIEDGVLTALEISTMDLSGTDMVVMSACETGLGDITSDGVFGLQRAFKMAGVQTLVMSLWKVDDNATSMMMQTFYEHLLSGMSKREAFNLAQATVRAKYPEPYYWAGFVMLD